MSKTPTSPARKYGLRSMLSTWRRPISRVLIGFAGLIAALASAAAIIDFAARYWPQHDRIEPLPNAYNKSTFDADTHPSVVVEALQGGDAESDSEVVLDAYLSNFSNTDVLFTNLEIPSFLIAFYSSAGIWPAGPLNPSASYTITAAPRPKGFVPLAPPFLLRAHSRAGIRVRFVARDGEQAPQVGGFVLYDTTGEKLIVGDRVD